MFAFTYMPTTLQIFNHDVHEFYRFNLNFLIPRGTVDIHGFSRNYEIHEYLRIWELKGDGRGPE